MDLLTIAQTANPILQLIFIVVIGLGYSPSGPPRGWFKR